MSNETPLIGVTLGDPAGIGPEVVLKAALQLKVKQPNRRLLLAGSASIAESNIERYNLSLKICTVSEPEDALSIDPDKLALLDISTTNLRNVKLGKADPYCANAATSYVIELVNFAIAHRIAAIACAPVSKQALLMSDFKYSGHTELIAELCGADNFGMFFTSPKLDVMTVTGHIPIYQIESQITVAAIHKKLMLANSTFFDLKRRHPKIAVCSVDPHCGENGLLGHADTEIVNYAVDAAKAEGLHVDGPISADAVFRPYIRERYDLILGMYHDQAKVGVAALNSDDFVAYLAGIPIVRTTTTHGSALDIAGQGIADPINMIRAIEVAYEISRKRSVPMMSDSLSALPLPLGVVA